MSDTDRIPAIAAGVLRFGAFELDTTTGELHKSGRLVRLQPQPFKVLAMLACRSGHVISREELKRAIWGNDTFVDFERGLNFCIAQVRTALGDDADSARFIQTLPRRGYRFIAPVETLASSGAATVVHEPTPMPPHATSSDSPRAADRASGRSSRRWAALAVGLTVALGVAAVGWRMFAHSAPTARVMIAVLPFSDLGGDTADEYLSQGLTEEMITQLGRIEPARLGVIARTSVMR